MHKPMIEIILSKYANVEAETQLVQQWLGSWQND